MAAISDASTTESHSFALNWSAPEIERLTSAARKLASDAAAKYAAQRFPSVPSGAQRTPPSQRSRTRSSPGTAHAQLEDVKVKLFDVDFDNNPEIVLTARESLPVPGGGTRTLYLALAARDEQGSALYPLLSYITDEQRLDALPRLEFVDAADADGDGVAEFLFRSIGVADENGNLSRGFQLYHTGPDRLRKVFDSSGPAD